MIHEESDEETRSNATNITTDMCAYDDDDKDTKNDEEIENKETETTANLN